MVFIPTQLLRAQKQATAEFRKSSKHRRRPAQLSEELRLKRRRHRESGSTDELPWRNTDVSLACRERIWKFKAQLELKEERAVKITMMFHRSALRAQRKEEKTWLSCCTGHSAGPQLGWGSVWGLSGLHNLGGALASSSAGESLWKESSTETKGASLHGFQFFPEM